MQIIPCKTAFTSEEMSPSNQSEIIWQGKFTYGKTLEKQIKKSKLML